jgi:hypothetical protein
MGKTLILKTPPEIPNTISFMLIIFTLQLIQSIRLIWFCHRSAFTPNKCVKDREEPPLTSPPPVLFGVAPRNASRSKL